MFQGRRRTAASDSSRVVLEAPGPTSKVNHLYGVKAWRSWVQQRRRLLPDCEHSSPLCYVFVEHCSEPVSSSAVGPVDVKEDVLQCDSAELSFALSRFIREVRRPNGAAYSPDSIFYLCLGIQQVHTHTVNALLLKKSPQKKVIKKIYIVN